MQPPRPTLLASSLILVACATTAAGDRPATATATATAPTHADAPSPGSHPGSHPGPASPSTSGPSATEGGFALRGAAPPSNEISVTGNSDLPAGMASSAQPFALVIEAAVRPLRPALAECLRFVGPPGRRSVRVMVGRDGELHPRPPQPYPSSEHGERCVTGVLRAGTVDPPPPMDLPWDIAVEVTP